MVVVVVFVGSSSSSFLRDGRRVQDIVVDDEVGVLCFLEDIILEDGVVSVDDDSFWKGSRGTKYREQCVSGVFVYVGQRRMQPVSRTSPTWIPLCTTPVF